MPVQDFEPVFKRILLKLSGEVLMGECEYGIDIGVLTRIASEVQQLRRINVEVGMVIGGGNLFRGAGLAKAGMDRVTADHMGMLATVMNSLAMQDTLERIGVFTRHTPFGKGPARDLCCGYR
jgi:uridylate kinase